MVGIGPLVTIPLVLTQPARQPRAAGVGRRRAGRALRRTRLGGTWLALPRLGRDVRVPARGLRPQGRGAASCRSCSCGSLCCRRRCCSPAATSASRSTRSICGPGSAGPLRSRASPCRAGGRGCGGAAVTIALLYRSIARSAGCRPCSARSRSARCWRSSRPRRPHFNAAQALSTDRAGGSASGCWRVRLGAGHHALRLRRLLRRRAWSATSVAPARTIPLAVVISIIIVAALYIALQIGVLGVVPWQ